MSDNGVVRNQPVRLDDLQAHGRNYNAHSPAQVKRIAKSLSTFGQVRSVVVWRNTILAGHGVVLAAKSLGWQTLRADVVDELSEDEALAYVVADNELARQSDPDQAQLAAILEELQQREPLLVEAAGYGQMELEQLLAQVANGFAPQDPNAEWVGMPAFEMMSDKYRSLIVHFAAPESVNEFLDLIGQQITEETKFIWFPAKEKATVKDKVFISES